MSTRVTSSQKKSSPTSHTNVAIENTKATVIANEIKVIIPGLRWASSERAMERNGKPPYTKMNVAKNGTISAAPTKSGASYPNQSCIDRLKINTGALNPRLTQNRLRNISSCPP